MLTEVYFGGSTTCNPTNSISEIATLLLPFDVEMRIAND
jgi:hypothetical protein